MPWGLQRCGHQAGVDRELTQPTDFRAQCLDLFVGLPLMFKPCSLAQTGRVPT